MSLWAALARASAEGARRPRGPVALCGALDVDVETLLAGCPAPWCFWDDRVELALGLGEFAIVDARGDARFAEVKNRGTQLLNGIRRVGEAMPQRLFGSFAFASQESGPFAVFGDARFVLPRLTVVRKDGRTQAAFVIDESELGEPDRLAAELAFLLERSPSEPGEPARVLDDGSASYLRAVERALTAISARRVEKIVTARVVRLKTRVRPERALSLLANTPNATRFGMRNAAGAFIAATPELLCDVRGDRIRTEALAGTSAVAAQATDLSESEKDRREHAHVVRGVVEALGSLGIAADIDPEPELRAASHVRHLLTAIEAPRTPELNVLDLVEALHPTPAVGGFPRAAASALLREIEPEGRGPYSAPCGWFDAGGDGSFVVGIRSALFRGRDVFAFAGAGIVAGSEPHRELFETDLKLRTMLAALGIGGLSARSPELEIRGNP